MATNWTGLAIGAGICTLAFKAVGDGYELVKKQAMIASAGLRGELDDFIAAKQEASEQKTNKKASKQAE